MVRAAIPFYVYGYSAQGFHIQISLNMSLEYIIVLCELSKKRKCAAIPNLRFVFAKHICQFSASSSQVWLYLSITWGGL